MHHCTAPSKTGWPTLNVVIFPPVMYLVLDYPNSEHPGDYWSNSRDNLGRSPDLSKSIAEQLGISRERVGSIIHEDLDMQKLSAKWVPKCLNTDQKRHPCRSSKQILDFFSAQFKWFPVVTGDHGQNLVISLWPRDKATINGVAA